jgi:GGDEF domain-containing protein
MELIYCTSPGTPCPQGSVPDGVSLRCCTDFKTFVPEVSRISVFIVALDDRDAALGMVHALRRDPRTGLQPIFTRDQLGEPADCISDGIVHSPHEVVLQARALLERLEQLDASLFAPEASDFFRILGYMFSRAGMSIAPRRLWSNQSFYTYPVLEAMLGSYELVVSRLAALCDRKLILHNKLIDRLRHCPACNGVHLNFIDCCPNCTGINILQKPFLHCFTCGTVAPEDRFVNKGVLQCPNCTTRLRHIGADYDRPLENYECQSCGHVCIEPEVQAHCMHCGVQSPPDKLVPEQIFSYELTDLGVQAAKNGTMEDLFALLDTVNSVSPSYFMNLVSWLIDITRRHPDEHFSIIGIKLNNLLELDARFGKQVVAELLDALALRLRALVRSTDLTTRTGQQMFWLLLPKTGKSSYQVVLNRILELRHMAYRVEGVGLAFDTVVFSAPEDVRPEETGKLLLARLEGGIE